MKVHQAELSTHRHVPGCWVSPPVGYYDWLKRPPFGAGAARRGASEQDRSGVAETAAMTYEAARGFQTERRCGPSWASGWARSGWRG